MYKEIKSYKKTKEYQYNGKRYDSRKEAAEARTLHQQLENNEIANYEEQVAIDFFARSGPDKQGIIVANPDDRHLGGWLVRYYCDFKIYHNDGTIEYREVKGIKGQDFKLKWQLMDSVFGNCADVFLTIII